MRRAILLFTATAGVFAVAACSSGQETANGETTEDRLQSGENVDVQVISAAARGSIAWGWGSPSFDPKKCTYSDRDQRAIGNQFTSSAKADCTEELARGQDRAPINSYHEPLAWIREDPSLSYVVFRHWCAELDVVVAVKAAAWDSAGFEGIGFYAFERTLNADDRDRRTFYAKDDSRLKRVGDGTLKNGERVYLYRFGGAGPCETNGTGDNPTHEVEFKPFVRYQGDIERWESVHANHGIRYGASWDRKADLLR